MRSQLDLPLPSTWGGRRKNAGRKPNRSRVSRRARPELTGRHPVHVTLRVLPEIPSLRVLNASIKRALIAGASKPGFRLIYFSIQGNHLHLIAEAETKSDLSRGIQGLTIRLARSVNRSLSRKRGKVFSDRFHEHVLTTPSETRRAIAYVVENYRRHCEKSGRSLRPDFIDEHSSAIHLAGLEKNPLPTPRFWMLTSGAWLAGPIDVGRYRVLR